MICEDGIYYDENGNACDKPDDYVNPELEHEWVKHELKKCDMEIKFHETNDQARMKNTLNQWHQYSVALRNYTSLVDGKVVIKTDKPTINQ